MIVLIITDKHNRARQLLESFSIGYRAQPNTRVIVRSVAAPNDIERLLGYQFDVAFVDPDARFSPPAYEAVWGLISVKSAQAEIRAADMELKAKERK